MSNEIPKDKITKRAYEIFEARGSDHGKDLDDWIQAEKDVLAKKTGDKKTAATTIKKRKV